jgi:hypothetical protein
MLRKLFDTTSLCCWQYYYKHPPTNDSLMEQIPQSIINSILGGALAALAARKSARRNAKAAQRRGFLVCILPAEL